jgi:hypothetical protein
MTWRPCTGRAESATKPSKSLEKVGRMARAPWIIYAFFCPSAPRKQGIARPSPRDSISDFERFEVIAKYREIIQPGIR